MIITQYGIVLKRITEADIELIRQWRNHPDIRKKMAYKKYITQKMQKKWFAGVDNKFNYYFLIMHENEPVGVINAKNLNPDEGYGEGGIFVWKKELLSTHIPVFATLCLLNFVFDVINVSNKSFIQVLKTNPQAIKYNRALGYRLIPHQEKLVNQWYILTREDYKRNAASIIKGAELISGDKMPPLAFGESSYKNLDEINRIIQPSGK